MSNCFKVKDVNGERAIWHLYAFNKFVFIF